MIAKSDRSAEQQLYAQARLELRDHLRDRRLSNA
jgi:hypothetical protein